MFTRIAASTAFLSIAAISLAHAQGVASDKLIESITVTANRQHVDLDVPAPTASKTADNLRAQNLVNPEDALKYLATDPIDSAWLGEKPRAYRYGADGRREAISGVIQMREGS
jgi:iron complex outermembrane recepter protein